MKMNNTKRSLIMSLLSMMLCISMLIGSTFAWFTDTATSSNNKIVSGSLKVDLELLDKDTNEWASIKENKDPIFNYTLWEPGYTDVKILKVENEGTLALRWTATFSAATEAVSKLADVIDVYVKPGQSTYPADRNDLTGWENVGTIRSFIEDLSATTNGELTAAGTEGAVAYLGIALKMQESAGNEYQDLEISPFDITILATQNTVEEDNFDNVYDQDAIDAGVKVEENGVTYVHMNDGGVVLYDVSEFEGDTLVIPEGTTSIGYGTLETGGKQVFAGNTDIKHIEFPSTVETVGYQAFKGSGVETVVLNEGLTVIDAYAFNGAANLSSINIPSTVKRIEERALRSTALTELVIPASVEYVDEAFRDITTLTSVIFEGNTQIAPYAFRGCTNLKEVYLKGADTTFAAQSTSGNKGQTFAPKSNGDANGLNIYVENYTVAERLMSAQTSVYGYKVYVANEEVNITTVSNTAQLTSAVEKTSATANNLILLNSGTYTNDIELKAEKLGARGDITFKAANGETPILSGLVDMGYRKQNVGAEMFNSNVTFEGIIFDQATAGKHSLNVQDVKSLTLTNCTIIGDGEYGIGSEGGNATGPSKITNCTFENAKIQILGNFGTGLVIAGCTFNNSGFNVQGGNSVTAQNCTFDCTIAESNVGDSFYLVRSNSTPITVKDCEIKIDSALTEVAVDQAKWAIFWNRGTKDWTVNNVKVTLTDAAKLQDQLLITKTTSTGVINCTGFTVNGVVQ